MKYLHKLLLIVIFLFTFTPSVIAADINITCNATSCSPASNLFPATEVWYPGKTLTKTINLNNTSGDPIEVTLTNGNATSTGNLSTVIQFTITRIVTGINVFDKTIDNFYGTTLSLPTLVNKTNEDYTFTATMNSTAGNEFQNKNTSFDLNLNFTVGSPPAKSVSGGGDGGAIAGTTTAATVCNATKPGSAPVLQSVVAGTNSVTLNWSQATDPVGYYLIAYGVSPNNNTYGNPNVGGNGTTSYTISGLSGGTTYCFIVRAGNGCAPGDFSNQICTTPGGGFVAAGPAPGFAPGVLGAATESAALTSTPSEKNIGEIKGAQVKNCSNCIWWPILLAELVILIIYYRLTSQDIFRLKHKIISLILAGLTYTGFLLINPCLEKMYFVLVKSGEIWCRTFILFDLALLVFIYLLRRIFTKQ